MNSMHISIMVLYNFKLWNTYQTLPEGRDIKDFTVGISFLKNIMKSLLLKRQKIGDEVEWHPQSNFNITDS